MVNQTLINQAKYALVHDAKGGAVALAPLLKIRPDTLSHKVNPRADAHHLMVDEALQLQFFTGDHRLLEAEALSLGYALLPMEDLSGISDMELLNAYTHLHKEFGDLATTLHTSLSDGRITKSETENFKKESADVISALAQLRQRFESLCDEA